MPITSFMNGVNKFDRETTRVMGVAFEMTRVALRIANRSDGINKISNEINEIIAKRIMELTRQGERNPDLLCERVLESLGGQYLQNWDITPVESKPPLA